MSALALLRNWRLILGGIALGTALIWGAIGHMGKRHYQKLWTNEKAAHVADNTRWTDAQALANARATSAKLAAEAEHARIEKEKDHALTLIRADYNARLARFMRNPAHQSRAVQADLSGPSQSAGTTADPDPGTFLVTGTDLHRCTDAYAIARGWQDWWTAIQATQSPGGNNE